MSKVHIVIPIGVGAPGTPVQKFLEDSVDSVLNQTSKDYVLTVASDTNVPQRCKTFLESKNVNVKWFEPHTYFRKGGIWKKIFDTWNETDTEYVAFLHYDDIWHPEKLAAQMKTIEEGNLNGSWSQVFVIDENNVIRSGDMSYFDHFSHSTVGKRTCAFAHAVIVKRSELYSCGILKHESDWAANFEDVWAVYMHKIGNMRKSDTAKFFWRNHSLNISNTVTEEADFVKEQRASTQYSLEETLKDMGNTEFQKIVNEVQKTYQQ